VCSINKLDKPNFCGKATSLLLVVEKVTAGTTTYGSLLPRYLPTTHMDNQLLSGQIDIKIY